MDQIVVINKFLKDNNIHAVCVSVEKQKHNTSYFLKIENDCRIKKLISLSQELMLIFHINEPPNFVLIPENGLLRIDIITGKMICENLIDNLRTLSKSSVNLMINLGTSIKGKSISIDISKNPHMIVGGSTGSGKSSLLHTIIANLLIGTTAQLHIIDTKGIEFHQYQKLNKNISVHDSCSEAILLIKYLIHIMEYRFNKMKEQGCMFYQDFKFTPIVLIIDEFADLMIQLNNNECNKLLCQLTQKCRAAGIYCILATQRPSSSIITGVIKANFPARIACKVGSKIDSRIILDSNGAESINTIGQAIINNYNFSLEKFQVSYSPLEDIFEFMSKNNEKMATTS